MKAHHWLIQGARFTLSSIVAVAVGAWAVEVNLTQSCLLRQWPYFTSCQAGAKPGSKEELSELLRRLQGAPGDAIGWMAMASTAGREGITAGSERDRLYDAATKAAGVQPELLKLRVDDALAEQEWNVAIDLLIQLVEEYREQQAAMRLALLVGKGVATEVLVSRVEQKSTWPEATLRLLERAKVPANSAMPLIVEALHKERISPQLAQSLMKRLKEEGNYLAAYAVWAGLVRKPLPAIFNGDFEQTIFDESFDWDIADQSASRAGAVVSQARAEEHGSVLSVRYSGRRLREPVARQVLLLPGRGNYTFAGEFAIEQLRSSNGLAWTFNCLSNAKEIARTAPLQDTGGRWQAMKTEFRIPADCGIFVVLQLLPFELADADKGLRGQAMFDNFRLEAGSIQQP